MKTKLLSTTLLIALGTSSVHAQQIDVDMPDLPYRDDPRFTYREEGYAVPRTEYGQPDLQGVWNYNSTTVRFERPEAYGDKAYMADVTEEERQAATAKIMEMRREQMELAQSWNNSPNIGGDIWRDNDHRVPDPRTALIVYPETGRLPAANEGVNIDYGIFLSLADRPGQRPVRFQGGGLLELDGPEDRALGERCIQGFNSGPPMEPTPFYSNYVQIFQSRDHVVLVNELIHKARRVYMDDRPFIDDGVRQWYGDSRGYWDGDTLVVETKNFNDLTKSFGPHGNKRGNAYNKTLIERFTRVADDFLEYEVTVIDPVTFTDIIVMMVPMNKDGGLLYEFACHEGNYSMTNALRGARTNEQDASESED